jgi:hypothetical protein
MQPAWAALPHDSQVSLGARELSSTAIHCCQALPVDQAIKWPLKPKKNHLWIPVPLKKKKTPAAHPPSNTHRRSTSSLPWSQSWSHNPWDPPLSALHHDWPSVYGAKYSVLVAGYIHASMISIHVYAFCVGEPLPKYNVVGSHLPKKYYIREPPHMGWL